MTEKIISPSPWYIAVGASGAEGLNDLKVFLSGLPADLDAVVLIVLHRPWDRISHLRSVLGHASNMPVVVAIDGKRFEPGNAYIGEPAEHLTLVERTFGELVQDPERQYRNRTVDLLFHSVAVRGQDRVIGIILSGSLDDGARGLAAINHAGGLAMVITPSEGWPNGMPEHAISYDGPIDFIGGARQIAGEVERIVKEGRPKI